MFIARYRFIYELKPSRTGGKHHYKIKIWMVKKSKTLTCPCFLTVYDNGQEYKMICLTGTIPMPYKGSTYNIPVNIWIHADYPSQAPIVLVTPTKDMQIKPSKIVDNNGRVYLPYLHEWKPSQVNV